MTLFFNPDFHPSCTQMILNLRMKTKVDQLSLRSGGRAIVEVQCRHGGVLRRAGGRVVLGLEGAGGGATEMKIFQSKNLFN